MSKLILVSILCVAAFGAACSSSSTNANVVVNSNSNSATNANLPPEFSSQPVQPSGNSTPGIPATNSISNKIPPNTAGINPANAVRTLRPGEKIPGIDVEAARRQMQQLSNSANRPTNSVRPGASPKKTQNP